MRSLYVFTHDLRIHDNALLKYIADHSASLYCLYIFDKKILGESIFLKELACDDPSHNRKNFLSQSLYDLEKSLAKFKQVLHYQTGDTLDIIKSLHAAFHFDAIGITQHPGVYEQAVYSSLYEQGLPVIKDAINEQFTLLTSKLDMLNKRNLQSSFTQFRKKVEPIISQHPISEACHISQLPPPVTLSKTDECAVHQVSTIPHSDKPRFIGGETAALKQLNYYCEPGRLDHYKNTRNGLIGWDFSSKLSPWLANGSLSARKVWLTTLAFEEAYGANDSTYWLRFELLWREYFQWLLYAHQQSFFSFSGINGHHPTASFNSARYQAWINGRTGFAGVDAAMQQLRQTGWMSNRARQWAASCLTHELHLDWRYGAAFFEQELIDFDVASNWGNWQYLAGVGTDPRGSRRFNLDKQLALYDQDGLFCSSYMD